MEKYKKLKIIGRGAFGVAYLCHRTTDNHRIVIKEIPVDEMSNAERQTSLNEANVHSMMDHPNIICYYESFLIKDSMIIAMEYAEGGTLYDFLQARNGHLLDTETILNFFVQVSFAVHHIHARSILHRDLKSQNLLLDKTKTTVKIADFGISKILRTKSKAVTVLGTLDYISPELCEGRPYCQKSDIWSLGCILYELITLKRPFQEENFSALIMKIMKADYAPLPETCDKNLSHLIRKMLHLDPKKRPSTAEILAQPFITPSTLHVFMQLGCFPHNPRSDLSASSSNNIENKPSKGLKNQTHASGSNCDWTVWFLDSTRPTKITFTIPVDKSNNRISRILLNKIKYLSQIPRENFRFLGDTTSNLLGQGAPEILNGKGSKKTFLKLQEENLTKKEGIRSSQLSINDLKKLSYEDSVDFVTGNGFAVWLTRSQVVYTVGKGRSGCLGHDSQNDCFEPTSVEAIYGHSIISIDCGPKHVLVVSKDNEVFAWGDNEAGCISLENIEYQPIPRQVIMSLKCKISQVFCGEDCSFAITTQKLLLGCGSNRYNRLAMDTESCLSVNHVPTFAHVRSDPLPSLPIACVAPGKFHTAFLTEDNAVYTVGSNSFGQLGRGSLSLTYNMPSKVENLGILPVISISSGDLFTVAVTEEGECFIWGRMPRRICKEEGVYYMKLDDLPLLQGNSILQATAHGEDIVLVTSPKS